MNGTRAGMVLQHGIEAPRLKLYWACSRKRWEVWDADRGKVVGHAPSNLKARALLRRMIDESKTTTGEST